MDLTNMTPTERAAWHRREADRIEAEERARRPALAAGQVWEHPEFGHACLFRDLTTNALWMAFIDKQDGVPMHVDQMGDGGEIVPGASLRVAPPDPPSPQVAPEPTGAELVGRRCWVKIEGKTGWRGPEVIEKYDGSSMPYRVESRIDGFFWFTHAKPYVEGVAP